MADKAIVSHSILNAIGQAIIDKGGATSPMLPQEMAAKIEAIPSGGDEMFRKYIDKTLTRVNLAEILGYDAPTPVYEGSQRQFQSQRLMTDFYGPMYNMANYAFDTCFGLVNVTMRNITKSSNAGIPPPNSLKHLTLTAMTAGGIISGYAAQLAYFNTDTIVHCTDKDVRYIDGAWVAVERS